MKKIIFSLFLVLILTSNFAQKPFIDAGNDRSVNLCPPTCDTLKATTSLTNGSSTVNYTRSSISYAPEPFDSGTFIGFSNTNTVTTAKPIGFDFCFFGDPYSDFYIGSNGWIGFSPNQTAYPTSMFSNPPPIPNVDSTKVPRNAIFWVWSNLSIYSGPGVNVYYKTYGTAPNRKLVVSFYNTAPHCLTAHSGPGLNGQIIIYETTNVIDMFIDSLGTECKPGITTQGSLQGLLDKTGTKAAVDPTRNGTLWGTWGAVKDGVRYTPNATGTYTINWFKTDTSATNLIASDTAKVRVCPTTNTSYIAQLVYNSCPVDTFYDTVVVNTSGTNGDATITPRTFCSTDSPDTLVAASPGGVWSGTGITNTSVGIFSPIVAGVGTRQIVYVISGTCSDTDTVGIVVSANLDATITTPIGPYCTTNAAVTLTAKDGGGLWTGLGITNAIAGIFNPLTAGGGTHTITYTISGACGDVDTETIIVDTIIDATINAATFCPGDPPTILTAKNPNKGVWAGSGITNVSTGQFTPTLVGLGTCAITYTTTNGTCTDVGTATITVSNTTDASIVPVGPFCENEGNKTLTAATGGGTWTGTGITNATLGTFSPTTAGGGTYTITYTIGGACGASSTTSIVVDDTLDASFLAPPFCDFDPADTLVATNSGGTWSGNGITNTTLGIFDPSVVTIGEHPITHITINGTCTTTSIKNIKVDSVFDATITLVTPKCLNAPAFTLQAATSGGIWSGAGITDVNNGIFDPDSSGVYSITYIILGSCGDIDSVTITITEPPVVILSITDENCPGDCDGAIFSNIISGGTLPFSYSWSNGSTAANIDGLCANNYSLEVNDGNQCKWDSSVTVTSNTNPIADFIITPNPATTSEPTVYFTDSSTFGVMSWDWIFYDSDGITKLNTSSETNPVITYPAAIGEYPVYLKITDENGCVDSTAQLLLIDGEYIIYVPNAFTPNGDGFNETFFPQGVGINLNDNYHLYIFDRWGELIWESDETHLYWDGTKDGVLVQDGVYIWKLLTQEETLEEEQYQYIGHVTVIK